VVSESRLSGMTITPTQKSRRFVDDASLHLPARCDVCGATVMDIAEHVAECVDRELEMFAVGRRAS